MFVGQIGAAPHTGNTALSAAKAKSPFAPKQVSGPRYDRVEIGAHSQTSTRFEMERPDPDQMQALETPSAAKATPDSGLQRELLPPSERSSYTEEDALMNQYMKQSRIDGQFVDGTFVRDSSEPVKLILKEDITEADLQKFADELAEKGLGGEIDWQGVKNDLVQIGVGFDNIQRFEQKADYLASRYAVLKDRIQSQFTGDKQQSELQKLEQLYAAAKDEMASSYAESVGGFYEGLGWSGAAADMRDSVLALIDEKADAYLEHIEKEGMGVSIADPGKQWLMEDDGYLAAQLRQSFSASAAGTREYSAEKRALYDGKDLSFAGVYARTLSQRLQGRTGSVNESDAALGRSLALQYCELKNSAAQAGISERLSNMLASVFDSFMGRWLDALDALIDKNRDLVADDPRRSGAVRTDYIDRESVYRAFQDALS